MTHLIDKDTLLLEIERRRNAALMRQHNLESIGQESVINEMVANELNRIIFIIDTLEVKEVDLEKEYEEFVVDDPILGNFITNDTMGMELAKHFFELGLKAQKGE